MNSFIHFLIFSPICFTVIKILSNIHTFFRWIIHSLTYPFIFTINKLFIDLFDKIDQYVFLSCLPYLSVHLWSIQNLSIYLSINTIVYLSMYLSVYLSMNVSYQYILLILIFYIILFLPIFIHLTLYPYYSSRLSIYYHLFFFSVYPSIYLSICFSICLF